MRIVGGVQGFLALVGPSVGNIYVVFNVRSLMHLQLGEEEGGKKKSTVLEKFSFPR